MLATLRRWLWPWAEIRRLEAELDELRAEMEELEQDYADQVALFCAANDASDDVFNQRAGLAKQLAEMSDALKDAEDRCIEPVKELEAATQCK